MWEILDIWPVAVAISIVSTGAYVVACRGRVRVTVETKIDVEVGK